MATKKFITSNLSINRPSPLQVFREFRSLAGSGVLGKYSGCEIYHLFFYKNQDPDGPPYNLFTLVHFGELQCRGFSKSPIYLNPKRILVSGKSAKFILGIQYYQRSTVDFAKFYRRFLRSGIWNLSCAQLRHDADIVLLGQYVPPDQTLSPALNRILKNNFFSGAHLIEHFDEKKTIHADFLNEPNLLSKTSDEIAKFLPLRIGSVSDRLGNIILQFPIDSVRAEFYQTQDEREVKSTIRIGQGAGLQDTLTQVSFNEGDNGKYLHGSGIAKVMPPFGRVQIGNGSGIYRNYLFDSGSGRIVSSFIGSYIKTMQVEMNISHPEPRVLRTENRVERIQLIGHSARSQVGYLTRNDVAYWERQRLFTEETQELEKKRIFVQYAASSVKEREKAKADLVELIRFHGKGGVWLWDPYLTADDLITTLFRNPFMDVEMRALGSSDITRHQANFSNPKENKKITWRLRSWWKKAINSDGKGSQARLASWIEKQQQYIESIGPQSRLGLRLEFRIQNGSFGWQFHDRFLLFPNKGERPRVWSLGTSVNSVGLSHHILQEVSHPARVIAAFESLWGALSDSSCRVWSFP